MRISPEQIYPSQDYLKPDTVAFIFRCIQEGKSDQLPPMPIVRQGTDGHLIAIDGHNIIAVRLYRREDIDVHVARSAADGLLPTSEANTQRNKDLREKFDSVIDERSHVSSQGITTFWDLIRRYPELFP